MSATLVTAAALLLVGFALRVFVRPLQWLFIPASVVGGIVGLIAMRAHVLPAEAAQLRNWPSPLLALIFAVLLLEKPQRSWRDSVRGAARQGVMAWIIIVGQAFIGLLATWLLVRPFYDVPAAFGQLIETGFAGGHGTAGAMGAIFTEVLGFPQGMDLGMLFATVGLVGGVVLGIVYINLAVRLRWVRGGAQLRPISGLGDRLAPQPMAFRRVASDVVDPLAFQLALAGLAFGIGWVFQRLFIFAAATLASDEAMSYIDKLPLFLFTLLGGLTLRRLLMALRLDDLVDPQSLKRISGAAMELLIVAAITTLQLEAVLDYLWPVVLLLVLGFAWSSFCLLFLARRLLPRGYWAELGLINFGMSTGTTAQGMMLLRIVDKDLTSGAAEDYALAAPLSAPFIGGGVITLTLPLVMQRTGIAPVVAVLGLALVALYLVGRRLNPPGD